ncbi:MAG: Rrf2 family transcriptional regulator [Gallionella sp.]|nr:Rrf2 family transcriptional regulator [Gallionella sp.]
MRLTTKGRFAVTAMADLATRGEKRPVTLSTISEKQKISLSYLEQLFGKLRHSNIVESVRGPGGGYYLARPAEKITIAEIIVAVDEPLDATQCGGKGNCHGEENSCITHELWMGLNENILEYLNAITLQQLVDDHNKSISGVSDTGLKKAAKL